MRISAMQFCLKATIGFALTLFAIAVTASAQPRISEDRDLKSLDLTAWDCLNSPGGSAKTADGAERNAGKNRSPVDLAGRQIPSFDTAQFLQHLSTFENATKHKRRKDLTPAERQQLDPLEKEIVSLTAYLVMAYPGPPETTNCGSMDFHDWHLELFEKPQDHAPHPGDPTPIICEITPRTQNAIFNSGIRIQKLAGFFRNSAIEAEPLMQPPQRVKITGYLLWDDEHNGTADVGPTVERISPNKFHNPWRSTAWEIHPVLKIEPLDSGAAPLPAATTSHATVLPSPSLAPAATPPSPAIAPAPARREVTILDPVKVKIPYGETMLPRGMKFPILSRDAQTVRVNYMGQTVAIPIQSTDLRQP